MRLLHLVLIFLCCDLVCSWEHFRALIPNGYNVFHPCKKNTKWDGVGHKTYTGGGVRNPFGRDFYEAGMKWTKTFCNKDSDGDNRSNGEELGEINKCSSMEIISF